MAKKHYDINKIVFAEKLIGPKFQDLEGKQFGGLVVLGFAGIIKNHRYWYCRCFCGNIARAEGDALKCGRANNCGCLRSDLISKALSGLAKTNPDEYRIYNHIKSRCNNEKDKNYCRYGKRGIKLLLSFEEFLDEVGPRPGDNFSIDRINTYGNYEKGNIRWATKDIQANNTRTNVFVDIDGETKTLAQWSRQKGISTCVINNRRRKHGWCDRHAITLPLFARKPTTCPSCQAIQYPLSENSIQ